MSSNWNPELVLQIPVQHLRIGLISGLSCRSRHPLNFLNSKSVPLELLNLFFPTSGTEESESERYSLGLGSSQVYLA
jgi:hypothetical protein